MEILHSKLEFRPNVLGPKMSQSSETQGWGM